MIKNIKILYILKKIIKHALKIFLTLLYNIHNRIKITIIKLIINKNSKKILAMNSQDFYDLNILHLLKIHTNIYAILSLDDDIHSLLIANKIPSIIFEDITDGECIKEINILAQNDSMHWADNIKEITKEGINWSLFDRESLQYSIKEIYTAKLIISSLIKQEKKIIAIIRTPFEAPRYYYANNNFAQTALVLNSKNIHYITIDSKKPKNIQYEEWEDIDDITNKIIFVLNSLEIHRCHTLLEDFCKNFPNQIRIFSLAKYAGTFSSAPVFCTPPLFANSDDRAFLPILDYPDEDYNFDQDLVPLFKKILNYYCTYQWPALKRSFLRFKSLFSTQRPLCVLGTTLFDAPSQLATAAARQLGIPTYAWGHSLSQGEFPSYHAENIVLFCKYAMLSAQRGKNLQANLVACHSHDLDNLYNVCNRTWEDDKPFKILVLPINPFLLPGSSLRICNFYNLSKYIKTLCNIPYDLTTQISLRFKFHPMVPKTSLFDSLGLRYHDLTFTSNDNLLSLIDEANCCLLLGEAGCALVHACNRVPTIFCPLTLYGYIQQYAFVSQEFPHRCDRPEDTWSLIRQIMEDDDHAEQMLKKQKEWTHYDNSYPTPAQFLQTLIK